MTRKTVIGWVFLLVVLATSLQVYAQGGTQATVTQGVKFRAGPGTDWYWLGTLEAGTPITLDGRAPGGGWVRGMTPDGKVGWVVDSAVSLSSEQVSALPGVWVETPFGGSAPAGTPPSASAPENPPAPLVVAPLADGGLIIEAVNQVRMRTLPNANGQVILTITTGTRLTVDGRDQKQEWVRAALPNGTLGWLSAQFVAITPEQMIQLPVLDGTAPVAAPQAQPTTQAPLIVPPAAPIVNSAPVSGFSYGGHVEGFGQNAVLRMQQAGMSWAKRQYRYFAGQGAEAVAGWINDAHAKGFRILIGVVGAPAEVNNPGYFEQYAAFVGGVAALGADAIEVWNEMNIDREWPNGSIDAGRYVEMLRLSYNAIKGANPNTLVISGAPAPTGFFGGCSGAGCDDNVYIAGMARAGAANYADCIGLHYNEGIVGPTQTSGDPRGNSGYYTRYFSGMLNTYYNAFGGRRPLCFTELGYLTPEGFPPLPGGFAWAQGVTLGQQAGWLDQAVSLSARSGKVRLLIIWNVDFTEYSSDPMAGFAIIRPDGACPACEALGS